MSGVIIDQRACRIAAQPREAERGDDVMGGFTRTTFREEEIENEAKYFGAVVIDIERVRAMLYQAVDEIKANRAPFRLGEQITVQVGCEVTFYEVTPTGIVKRGA